MLKFFRFFSVFVLTAKLSFGQKDLIITQAGEEIRCKILDETPTRFKYAYVGPKDKVLRNEIFKNLVSSFKYGYYDSDVLKNEKAIVKTQVPTNAEKKETQPVKKEEDKKEPEKVVSTSEPTTAPKEKAPAPKVVPKESTPKNNLPNKDLVRDLNKPSYPVNNQPKPIEVAPKKEMPIEEPKVEIVKKEQAKETPVVKTEVKPSGKPELPKPDVATPRPEIKTLPKTETSVSSPAVVQRPKTEIIKKETKPEVKIATKETPKVEIPVAKIEPKVDPKVDLAEKKEEPAKKAEEKAVVKTPIIEKKAEKPPVINESKEMARIGDPKANKGYKNFMRFRLGVKGGLGNVISKSSDTSPFGLYQEKLQRGWILGGDVSYFVKDWLGIGVKYASFQSNNKSSKLDFLNPVDQNPIKSGALANKVSHKFIGPTFLIRKSLDFKTYVVLTASPGVNLYSDKGIVNKNNFTLSGKSYGGNATLGIDFLLGNDIFGRDIILSIEGGYNYGSINNLTVSGLGEKKTQTTPINLNRLDFGVGLRFTRFPMYLR
jgi:hypothetical protein